MVEIVAYRPEQRQALLDLSLRAWAPVFPLMEQDVPAFVYHSFYPEGWRQRQAADAKADELLQRLSTPGGPCVLTTDEVELLKNLYTHHLYVFVRQRAVYRELADNLKDIEPDTDPDERDVLANHVCKSVQLLVAEAQRIDMLRHCLTTLGHL